MQVAEGVKPTLAELEKFEDAPESVKVDCILTFIYIKHKIAHWQAEMIGSSSQVYLFELKFLDCL